MIAQQNIQLLLFRATQTEIKAKFRETRDADELRAIEYQAEREVDRSISSRMIINWAQTES